jgi:hypothetical protein
MSLFEKIEPEPIESAGLEDEPGSSRNFKADDSLTIAYSPWMKLLLLLAPLICLPLFQLFLEEGFFFLEILCVGSLVAYFWFQADSLLTLSFTLYPDKIVQYRIHGRFEIPTYALVLRVKDQDSTFFHGSEQNIRESVQIRRFLISGGDYANLEKYAHDLYRATPNQPASSALARMKTGTNQLVAKEYLDAAANYRAMAALWVIFPLLAVFTVGLSDNFFGLAPSLPAYPVRLACIALAVGSFFLLRSWSREASQVSQFSLSPVMTRLERADNLSFRSATLSACVGALGLLLFFLAGNTLDLYLFLLVGGLYFYDCYPRLSTWEHLAAGAAESKAGGELRSNLPRRSLQISLVLMGTLAAMSYGESNHYLYANRKDCGDDWGDGKDCRELPGTGGSSGGHGGYYGPRYGSGGRPTRAVGVVTVSRGGFGSLGGLHASFGG